MKQFFSKPTRSTLYDQTTVLWTPQWPLSSVYSDFCQWFFFFSFFSPYIFWFLSRFLSFLFFWTRGLPLAMHNLFESLQDFLFFKGMGAIILVISAEFRKPLWFWTITYITAYPIHLPTIGINICSLTCVTWLSQRRVIYSAIRQIELSNGEVWSVIILPV